MGVQLACACVHVWFMGMRGCHEPTLWYKNKCCCYSAIYLSIEQTVACSMLLKLSGPAQLLLTMIEDVSAEPFMQLQASSVLAMSQRG